MHAWLMGVRAGESSACHTGIIRRHPRVIWRHHLAEHIPSLALASVGAYRSNSNRASNFFEAQPAAGGAV